MTERNIKIAYILLGIGITMIVIGFGILSIRMQKEAYCNSLEPMEYFENSECKELLQK